MQDLTQYLMWITEGSFWRFLGQVIVIVALTQGTMVVLTSASNLVANVLRR